MEQMEPNQQNPPPKKNPNEKLTSQQYQESLEENIRETMREVLSLLSSQSGVDCALLIVGTQTGMVTSAHIGSSFGVQDIARTYVMDKEIQLESAMQKKHSPEPPDEEFD